MEQKTTKLYKSKKKVEKILEGKKKAKVYSVNPSGIGAPYWFGEYYE